MSNLIITIISIALVAITALLGVVFLSPAYDSSVASIRANQLLSEGQQLFQAATTYTTEQGARDFSTAAVPNLNQLFPNYLSSPPNLLGGGGSWVQSHVSNGYEDRYYYTRCMTLDGNSYNVTFNAATNGYQSGGGIAPTKNIIMISFIKPTNCTAIDANAGNDVFAADDPIIKICKKFNSNVSGLPFHTNQAAVDSTTGVFQWWASAFGLSYSTIQATLLNLRFSSVPNGSPGNIVIAPSDNVCVLGTTGKGVSFFIIH